MLLTISVTVIAACILIFMIVLIPILLRFARTADELRKLIQTLSAQVIPLTTQMSEVIRHTEDLIQSFHKEAEHMGEGITALRDVAIRLRDFQREIQDKTFPLLKLASLIGFGSKGVLSFIKFFRR